jgi:hypothetical protein
MPRTICLEHDRTKGRPAELTFDIDSIVALPSCLSCAKRGIKLEIVPKRNTTLSNCRVGITVRYTEENGTLQTRHNVPVHKVPNVLLGRVAGFEDMAIYVLFPR